jgi:tRNA (guanine10-N2)-methyltransferase
LGKSFGKEGHIINHFNFILLAYVMGTDINYQMLHGKSKPTRVSQTVREIDESVLANLKQYNCGDLYVDVLVSDFSLPTWTDSLKFDSIITDR